MKYLSVLSILMIYLLSSCGNKGINDEIIEQGPDFHFSEEDLEALKEIQEMDIVGVEPEWDGDDAGYVSMIEFFDDQWKFRKDQPYTLQKIIQNDGEVVDSSYVGLDEQLWKEMIAPFIASDINDIKFKGKYTFEAIEDTDQPVLHFNYVAKEPNLEVKKTQLILDSYTNRIQSVYIERTYSKDGLNTKERLLYLVGRKFQIHQTQYKNGEEVNDLIKSYAFKF